MQRYLGNDFLKRFIKMPGGAGGFWAFFLDLTYIKIVIDFNGIKRQFQAETIFAKYPKHMDRIFR